MTYEKIDLYAHFGVKKPKGAKGTLTVMIPYNTPELMPKLRPAVLVCPGGGYGFMSDREGEPVALWFASKSYAAFVLDYTIFAKHPVPLTEACLAVAYIRENARSLGVDPDRIAAIGFSAGGHLVGTLATLYADECIKAALGDHAKNARPDAVILSYPVVTMGIETHGGSRDIITGGDPELLDKLSVQKQVRGDSVPAFIWHTHDDDCVPVENSLMLAEAYRRAGVPFALHIFEKGWHGISLVNAEVQNGTEAEKALRHIGKWIELAYDWLTVRGFAVSVKNQG